MGRKRTDLDFEKYDKLKETYGEGTNPYLPKKDAYAMSKMRKEIMKAIPKNFGTSEEPGKRSMGIRGDIDNPNSELAFIAKQRKLHNVIQKPFLDTLKWAN